ncbi:hypothetical protein [Hominiventricola filiformis]|uniref:Uncharacterized protein n=1 Tax=Hominiventricola filiformis TaxID=2885352 RepID=A0AAE3A514_9FIRM|nr:hypothetical protein [Hominiventricola filiformis]MCC2126151.1 hypothetical protein [Hominiventricola filiformis]
MNKIKLGVSAGLTGAILYFLGAISIIPAVILAGYILLKEENDWLKYQAVKMVMIVVIFGAINIGLNCIDDIFAIFNQVIGIFAKNVHIAVPLGLTGILSTVCSLLRNIVLIWSGINALNFKTVYVASIDELVSKNM